MGHRRVELDEVELSSDSDSDSEDLSDVQNQQVYPAPRNPAATADETLQLGCWDGNVLAELDDFLGVLDKEDADEGESSKAAESSGRSELSSRDGSKRKLGASAMDADEPFGFGATDVDQSAIANTDESVIGDHITGRLANVDESIIPSADESVMPTVEESVIAGAYEADAAPRMPCPPPAKRQKAETSDDNTTVAAMPPHRRRSQMPGSSVSSSRSSHYSTGSRGSSMFSSGRLSRAGSTFNGSAASVISNPFDEPLDPGLTRRNTFSSTGPPEILLCCLSKALMTDPVVAADGYTYERDAILEWRGQGKLISPMTQEAFGSDMLIVNQQIKKQLGEFHHQQNPGGEPEKQQLRIETEVVQQSAQQSALDCGILVPSEKLHTPSAGAGFGSGFAPMGGRAPVLSRPAMVPPPQPRGRVPGGGGGGGRRGSKGSNSARGSNHQPQQPQPQAQNLDCAILVPSGQHLQPLC